MALAQHQLFAGMVWSERLALNGARAEWKPVGDEGMRSRPWGSGMILPAMLT